VILPVLADCRELTPFIILKIKSFPKENFLIVLYFNIITKDGGQD
jgi:hypothetical protein